MDDLDRIQACLSNRLDQGAIGKRRTAGVIGTAPSQYSKSPALWNGAFRHLGMDAIYVPMDVEVRRVQELLAALRRSERMLGVNVTVPHKLAVMPYLDSIDALAKRIGAVNTIVRSPDGRLSGHNTDSGGFINSILEAQPGSRASFVPALENRTVLLLGAGGSARAVAFGVAERLGHGRLIVCNRTLSHAQELAAEIRKLDRDAQAIDEAGLRQWAPQADVIINSTTKGQGGFQRLGNGIVQTTEPYSSLACAAVIAVPELEYSKTDSADPSMQRFAAEVAANQRASLELAQQIPAEARFYDLIYHPEETIFLRHGRLTGHATMNGKTMIIGQAVLAFCDHICKTQLVELAKSDSASRAQITQWMNECW